MKALPKALQPLPSRSGSATGGVIYLGPKRVHHEDREDHEGRGGGEGMPEGWNWFRGRVLPSPLSRLPPFLLSSSGISLFVSFAPFVVQCLCCGTARGSRRLRKLPRSSRFGDPPSDGRTPSFPIFHCSWKISLFCPFKGYGFHGTQTPRRGQPCN
jgi:hypothetical protein